MTQACLPSSVKVGPFTYSITLASPEAMQKIEGFERELLGYCAHKTLSIFVVEGMHPDATAEVVLHELLHACYNVSGQPLDSMPRKETEENAVRVLAPTLLQVFIDNPRLVAYLGGR